MKPSAPSATLSWRSRRQNSCSGERAAIVAGDDIALGLRLLDEEAAGAQQPPRACVIADLGMLGLPSTVDRSPEANVALPGPDGSEGTAKRFLKAPSERAARQAV